MSIDMLPGHVLLRMSWRWFHPSPFQGTPCVLALHNMAANLLPGSPIYRVIVDKLKAHDVYMEPLDTMEGNGVC